LDAKRDHADYTRLGRDHVSAQINVEWIKEMTGWPKGKAEMILAKSLEAGYLQRSGSRRNGYRYTVTVALRTHRSANDSPRAASLFAADRTPPPAKVTSQLEMTDVAAAIQPPPNMTNWSKSDRDFYSRSSGAIRIAFASLSGADRKLFSRLSGENQELCSREPRVNRELLHRLSGVNDDLYSRRTRAKIGLLDDRARASDSIQHFYQKLLAESPELLNELLLLARKRKGEEDTTEGSATFRLALQRISSVLELFCDGDVDRAREILLGLVRSDRVAAHENPIGTLVRGICYVPRYLLTTQRRPGKHKSSDETEFSVLAGPLQESLLNRARAGTIDDAWCAARDIRDGARRHAHALVGAAPTPPANDLQSRLRGIKLRSIASDGSLRA
jgi:hypothetical protein